MLPAKATTRSPSPTPFCLPSLTDCALEKQICPAKSRPALPLPRNPGISLLHFPPLGLALAPRSWVTKRRPGCSHRTAPSWLNCSFCTRYSLFHSPYSLIYSPSSLFLSPSSLSLPSSIIHQNRKKTSPSQRRWPTKAPVKS